MKKLLLATIFLYVFAGASAQNISSTDETVKVLPEFFPPRTSVPLYFVSMAGREAEFPAGEIFEIFDGSLKIDSRSIHSIHVLKDQKAIDKYGERARNGAVVIEIEQSKVGLLPNSIRQKFD